YGQGHATGWFGAGASAAINPMATSLNDAGWNLAGGVGVTSQYAGVLVDVMYNEFGINRRTLNRVGADSGRQRFWAITLDPVFHVNERGPVDFYITGGGGLYGQMLDYRTRFGSRRDDGVIYRNTIYKAGVDGGAGFAFRILDSPAKIFVEARFHHMFTPGSGASFVPVTIGVSF